MRSWDLRVLLHNTRVNVNVAGFKPMIFLIGAKSEPPGHHYVI